jgi:DNA-directed RNA polymerase subunit M/transcription elongation factor TFIIS
MATVGRPAVIHRVVTAREQLQSHPGLRAAVASSTSFRDALVALGLEPLKNNVYQLRTLCTDMGISVAHIQSKKKHEDVVSVCPQCGAEFANKASGKEHKTYCGQKCANAAIAKTRNQQEINAKIKVATQQAMDKIAETSGPKKKPNVTLECGTCKRQFSVAWPLRKKRKYCSRSCANSVIGKKYGRRNGQLSAQKMVKRSKNEILFAELCAGRWIVTCNEPMFDGWDADVVLTDLKVAVLWNGVWHYKDKIRKGHSLLQVQTRDRIKLDVIEKHGYQSYVIKDMGKHNPVFVREEFEKFVEWCTSNATGKDSMYQAAPDPKPDPADPEGQEAAVEKSKK